MRNFIFFLSVVSNHATSVNKIKVIFDDTPKYHPRGLCVSSTSLFSTQILFFERNLYKVWLSSFENWEFFWKKAWLDCLDDLEDKIFEYEENWQIFGNPSLPYLITTFRAFATCVRELKTFWFLFFNNFFINCN